MIVLYYTIIVMIMLANVQQNIICPTNQVVGSVSSAYYY